MDGSLFYFLGGALVLAALGLAAVGIRSTDSFPRSKGQMAGVLAVFAAIVAGTATFAVANARQEQDKRNEEQAKEAAKAEQGVAASEQAPAGGEAAAGGGGAAAKPPAGEPPGAATTLDLTSPDDGSLVFDPDSLQASAGPVTLAYDNPSPVPHSIAIEDDEGKTLAESDQVAADTVEISAPLTPGQYTFYCTVPGHRESGMEGTLIVQ